MKLLFLIAVLSFGCGQDRYIKEYVPVPGSGGTNPPPSNGNNNGKPSYQETQALLVTYCQACHSSAQFMSSERALRSSGVLNRVRSGNMPPSNANRALPDAERRKILTFF